MHTIKKVEYIKDFKLLLTFKDNKKKVVDLEKFSKEGPETVFYPFRDLEFFKSVKVDKYTGTIVWPNGVDLCPDTLYETGKPVRSGSKSTPRKRRKISRPSSAEKPNSRIAAKSK